MTTASLTRQNIGSLCAFLDWNLSCLPVCKAWNAYFNSSLFSALRLLPPDLSGHVNDQFSGCKNYLKLHNLLLDRLEWLDSEKQGEIGQEFHGRLSPLRLQLLYQESEELRALPLVWDKIALMLPRKFPKLKNLSEKRFGANEVRIELASRFSIFKGGPVLATFVGRTVTELNLSKMGLKFLPSELNFCFRLETLDISSNALTSFSGVLLPTLVTLKMTNNPIPAENFPKVSAFLRTFSRLHFIQLDPELRLYRYHEQAAHGILRQLAQQIPQFPQEPLCLETAMRVLSRGDKRFASVTKLNLELLSLRDIPKELALLVNLQELNLSGNELYEIPEVIFELQQLKVLDLRGNPIAPVERENIQKAVKQKHPLLKVILSPLRKIEDKGCSVM
jgi:Leucine-rich repeat (LRR) protein